MAGKDVKLITDDRNGVVSPEAKNDGFRHFSMSHGQFEIHRAIQTFM